MRLGRHIYNKWFFRAIMTYAKPNSDILELGCGTASLGNRLAGRLRSYSGLDLSGSALAKAKCRSKKKNIHFIHGDMYESNFRPIYDIVWSQGLLEHFPNPSEVVERHLTACKRGGTVLISVPWLYSYFPIWYVMTRPRCFRRFWPWTEQQFFSRQNLDVIMRQVDSREFQHYRIFLIKPRLLGIIFLEIKK